MNLQNVILQPLQRGAVFSRLGAMALFLLLTLAAPAVAQERERLTGHGTTLMTVTSGGATTEGVRLDIDFRAARDRSGEFTGNFRVAAASETRAVVLIDRATYTLERITADPPFVVDTTSRPFTL